MSLAALLLEFPRLAPAALGVASTGAAWLLCRRTRDPAARLVTATYILAPSFTLLPYLAGRADGLVAAFAALTGAVVATIVAALSRRD